jgi:type IV secretory pathway protease TraF
VRRIDPDEPLEIGTNVVFKVEVEGKRYDRLGRIRGVAGDEAGAKDGFVTVNGEFVGPLKLRGPSMGTVPEGHLLILATSDTNTAGLDSRAFGFISRDRVWGIILE